MTNEAERWGGKKITIGGKEWLFAPLSIGAMKRFKDDIGKIGTSQDATEVMEVSIRIIAASLKRNYPDLTSEFIEEDIVDMSNFKELLTEVLAVSGYQKKEVTTPGKPAAEVAPT
jgi:hypothetical protein